MIRVLRLAAIEDGKVECGHRLNEALLIKKRLSCQVHVSRRATGMLFFSVVFGVVKPAAEEWLTKKKRGGGGGGRPGNQLC